MTELAFLVHVLFLLCKLTGERDREEERERDRRFYRRFICDKINIVCVIQLSFEV